MTARSVSGSVPLTVAGTVRPSFSITLIVAPCPAPATTWLLVTIRPSLLITMPDPVAAPCWDATAIFTTLGSTLAAALCTEPSGAAAGAAWLPFSGAVTDGVALESLVAEYTAAPPTPLAAPTRSAVSATAARPRRLGLAGSGWCAGCGPKGGQFDPGGVP